MSGRPAAITSGRLLARNAVLNVAGQCIPVVVAILAIPILTGALGTDRFGVLAMAWMVIGYFSLFDLGLGVALTKLVAERLGGDRAGEVAPLVWTALAAMALLGACGTAVLLLVAPWLVSEGLNIPPEIRGESLQILRMLALALPWVITTAGLGGVLEASQRFDLVNAVRVPMGMFSFLGPLLVLPFSSSLVPVVAVLVAGRVVAWGVHLALCLRAIPSLRAGVALHAGVIRPLLRFGGWMTVSNTISPLMVYFDRFVVAALLSVSAVAYYVTPYEVINKLLIVPAAFLGVLFPAFAASFASDPGRAAVLFDRAGRAVFLIVFPIVLTVVLFAPEGLQLWLGPEFAVNSAPVLRWLAVGVFLNGVARVPFSVIQGAGRPDLTAKLHMAELPFYLVAIYSLVRTFGIEGAAIAWTLRAGADMVVLLVLAHRVVRWEARSVRRMAALLAGGTVVLVAAGTLPPDAGIKLGALAACLLGYLVVAWGRVLEPDERAMVMRRLAVARGVMRSAS